MGQRGENHKMEAVSGNREMAAGNENIAIGEGGEHRFMGKEVKTEG